MTTPVLTGTGRRALNKEQLSWEDAAATDEEEEPDEGVSGRRAPPAGQKVNSKTGELVTSYDRLYLSEQ